MPDKKSYTDRLAEKKAAEEVPEAVTDAKFEQEVKDKTIFDVPPVEDIEDETVDFYFTDDAIQDITYLINKISTYTIPGHVLAIGKLRGAIERLRYAKYEEDEGAEGA